MKGYLVLIGVLCALGSTEALAKRNWAPYGMPTLRGGQDLPPCVDFDRRPLEVNNHEVIRWKEQSPNQYKDRALINGTLVRVIKERKSHLHIEVDLTPQSQYGDAEHIEIIYNREFGDVDDIREGDEVSACGDYITAREKAGPYPPSPVGAVLHWVHESNNPGKHAHGFLAIDGILYGSEGRGGRRYSEYNNGVAPWAVAVNQWVMNNF